MTEFTRSDFLSRKAVPTAAGAVLGAAVAGLSAPATSSATVLSGTAGGDLGGAFPTPTVLKASGAGLQVAGVLNSTLAHGTILNSVGFLDSNQDTLSAVRAMCTVSDTRNGTNGARGDSILSDAATAAGSSFFLNSMIAGVHNTRGSYQGYTSAATINEAREGNDIYGELGLFEATLQTNRRGAYTTCLEAINAVNVGKQARAAGLVTLIQEANPLSSYTMLSSSWNDTGARGLWLGSTGTNPAGTGIFINGDWARAAVYVQFNDQANYLLLSQPAGAAAPLFRANGLGRLEWGDTNSVTSNLYNAGGGYLKTDHGLLVGGNTLALQGSAVLENCVSASESTSATAGSHGAPPSQVAGYLTFIDSTGQSRKIAFYNP